MVLESDGRARGGSTVGSEMNTDIRMENMLENFDYEITRWIVHTDLKRQTKAVNDEIERHEKLQQISKPSVLGALSDYVLGGDIVRREKQSLLVDEYWSSVSIDAKYKGLSKPQIWGLLVLQSAFRTWITLKRCRERMKCRSGASTHSFGDDKAIATILYVKSAVKRVLAKSAVENKIRANQVRDRVFSTFCGLMKGGIIVTMFSRKYGNAPSRKISFDEGFHNLTFTTSFGTRRKIALKAIYKVHKGISVTMYPHARRAQLSRCVCLECLGDRVVDIELNSMQQASEVYLGFERLILLLSGTTSPFYVDNFGIPRRGGPSIIENAVIIGSDEGSDPSVHRSKPDEMRLWGAIRVLQEEYDSWQTEQDLERRAHMLQKDAEAERAASHLILDEKGKTSTDVVAAQQKVPKLVRFVSQAGLANIGKENSFGKKEKDMRGKVPNQYASDENTVNNGTKLVDQVAVNDSKTSTPKKKRHSIFGTKKLSDDEDIRNSVDVSESKEIAAEKERSTKTNPATPPHPTNPNSQQGTSKDDVADVLLLTGKFSNASIVLPSESPHAVPDSDEILSPASSKPSSVTSGRGRALSIVSSSSTVQQQPMWRAFLCFSPLQVDDDDDNGDYFLTEKVDDQSTMSCGDRYESSAADSNSSEEDDDSDDDDDDDDDDEDESSGSDRSSHEGSESSDESSENEFETDDEEDNDGCSEKAVGDVDDFL